MPMIIILPKHFAEVNFNPITFPESEDDMTTTAIERERKIRHVDVTLLEVEPDETLVFENHSRNFPCFTIELDPPDFARPGAKLEGDEQITITVAKHGDFTYTVRHYKEKGKKGDPVKAGPFGARSCPGGCNQ